MRNRLLAIVTVLTACSDTPGGDAARADLEVAGVIPAPFTPGNGVEFIDAMSPHHEMAIHMADEELARGVDPDVLAMAGDIRAAQSREVGEMEAIRQSLTDRPVTPMAHDLHADADMARLSGLSGEALDAAFLEEMIPHHAGAIELAHRALPNLDTPELRTMAEAIVTVQAAELGKINRMLEAMKDGLPD